MSRRHSLPKQGTRAAMAVLFALAWIGPAGASPGYPSSCDDAGDPLLEITESALTATNVSHDIPVSSAESVPVSRGISPAKLFRPGAAASLRKAFDDGTNRLEELTSGPVVDVSPPVRRDERSVAEADKPSTMNTRVPGVSSEELARYKRQMYRKDI